MNTDDEYAYSAEALTADYPGLVLYGTRTHYYSESPPGEEAKFIVCNGRAHQVSPWECDDFDMTHETAGDFHVDLFSIQYEVMPWSVDIADEYTKALRKLGIDALIMHPDVGDIKNYLAKRGQKRAAEEIV